MGGEQQKVNEEQGQHGSDQGNAFGNGATRAGKHRTPRRSQGIHSVTLLRVVNV